MVTVEMPENTAHVALAQITEAYNLGTVNQLREVMAHTNTVVSGSWALLAIFPNSFQPNDLDLYTSGSQDIYTNPLMEFLGRHGYYVITSMDTNYFQFTTGTRNTIRYIFKLGKPDHTATINVIVSRTLSELHPIFEFHSTIVMNFIAWYGFVCLYPSLTLHGRGLINHNPIPEQVNSCLEKYINRGFDLRRGLEEWEDISSHLCGVSGSCPRTTRNIHGNSVVFLPFDYGNILSDFIGDLTWQLRISC